MPRAIIKRLIERDLFFERDSCEAIERQTVPRTGRQVLPRGRHARARKSDAIARQDLPHRQFFPGRTCRVASATDAQKPAIYRAF
jgi:hypothetical protein